MTRRAAAHDYTLPSIYHITLHVAEGLGQPLGAVVGSLSCPDGSPEAPHTALSPVGKMVEHELLTAIHDRYPMVTIQDYVIMPEHLHFIAVVQDRIISRNGKIQTIGQIISGFKTGCNRLYKEITQRANPVATLTNSASSGFAAGMNAASSAIQPLFAPGYCDVMPVDAAQLAIQRAYIAGNPRSRLQRMGNRAWLMPRRATIATALTPAALRGYLQRECPPSLATAEALAAIESQLLLTPAAHSAPSASSAGIAPSRVILCDSYGNTGLLSEHRCLPVVCHRKDAARFAEQQRRCLEEAASGTTLVSACISPRERDIIKDAANRGFSTIIIADNGIPDRYHPSAEQQGRCAAGRLLLVSPWHYQYRGKNGQVNVPFCKTMNCVAQALCRCKDSWWKQ